jgi:predicted LPLAT superfamily acyltransferase
MSHVGSWEIAAQLLMRKAEGDPRIKLLLYLGEKRREQIEGRQKRNVKANGIRVISSPEDAASAIDILEGLKFLREGGLVSLTGDRLWSQDQKSVAVQFAGCEARIPEVPYILASLSGAPLLIFFGHRTGRGRYHVIVKPPIHVAAASRTERGQAVQQAAQAYADLLARTARAHPDEWYHFGPFLMDSEQREKGCRP